MGEANDRGVEIDYDQAREVVYGMTYDEWKEQYQEKASDKQMEMFNNIRWGEDTTE